MCNNKGVDLNQEQKCKIIALENDDDFKSKMIEIVKRQISDEKKYSEIRKVLNEKGIQLDDTDFDSLIFEVKAYLNNMLKLGSKQLENISAGAVEVDEKVRSSFNGISEDILNKIQEEENKAKKKGLLMLAGLVIGCLLIGGGVGGAIGYPMGKKEGEKSLL